MIRKCKYTSHNMLQMTLIRPCFQGLLTIGQIYYIHSHSCLLSEVFQYLISSAQASIGQSLGLAISPPISHIFLHFCLAWLKCYWTYFSTKPFFSGGLMLNNCSSLAWINSHCFGVCCLKLQIETSRWAYATSFTFCF
jgi:hypothetical protein